MLQPLKAQLPMLDTEVGIATLLNEEQFLNAHSPILDTELGMFTCCIDLPWVNASQGISSAPSGMFKITCLSSSDILWDASPITRHSTYLVLKTTSTVSSEETPASARLAEASSKRFSPSKSSTEVTFLVNSSSSLRKA